MVSVRDASAIILNHLYSPAKETIGLEHATRRVLAEPLFADRDLPPFHRVTMDGIAIAYEDWKKRVRRFTIEGTQAAGDPRKKRKHSSGCLEVMTGAVLPEGCDTVIRYEDLQIEQGVASVTDTTDILEGQNIHTQGSDALRGELLLDRHFLLSPAEIALLASTGQAQVSVFSNPRVAVVSTGDELVAIDQVPELHQIRRSNSWALMASLQTLSCPSDLYHIRDQKDQLLLKISEILNGHDVVILSGGVSLGKYDFVPEVLEELGIKKLFHQVSQRPGKPFWFGRSEGKKKTVFALPGNPVSTFMCFYRYVKPWLLKSLGLPLHQAWAELGSDFSFDPNLTYFLQVSVKEVEGRRIAYPEAGGGSGDFANLKNVDGFLELPHDRKTFRAGEVFPFFGFRV